MVVHEPQNFVALGFLLTRCCHMSLSKHGGPEHLTLVIDMATPKKIEQLATCKSWSNIVFLRRDLFYLSGDTWATNGFGVPDLTALMIFPVTGLSPLRQQLQSKVPRQVRQSEYKRKEQERRRQGQHKPRHSVCKQSSSLSCHVYSFAMLMQLLFLLLYSID